MPLPGILFHALGDRARRIAANIAKLPGFIAAEIGRLSGAAAKKVEPQSSAVFGFLSRELAFNVFGSMRKLTKAKPALSM
jgi:hypothetical protein